MARKKKERESIDQIGALLRSSAEAQGVCFREHCPQKRETPGIGAHQQLFPYGALYCSPPAPGQNLPGQPGAQNGSTENRDRLSDSQRSVEFVAGWQVWEWSPIFHQGSQIWGDSALLNPVWTMQCTQPPSPFSALGLKDLVVSRWGHPGASWNPGWLGPPHCTHT